MPKILAVVSFVILTNSFSEFPGHAATQLRFGGKCYLYFVGNFLRFPAVKKIMKICSDSTSHS